MEVHQWDRWARVYNRGDVMGFLLFFVVSIGVIWGILEYFGVGEWRKPVWRKSYIDSNYGGHGYLINPNTGNWSMVEK